MNDSEVNAYEPTVIPADRSSTSKPLTQKLRSPVLITVALLVATLFGLIANAFSALPFVVVAPAVVLFAIAIATRYLQGTPQAESVGSFGLLFAATIAGYLAFWPVCLGAGIMTFEIRSDNHWKARYGLAIACAAGLSCASMLVILLVRVGMRKSNQKIMEAPVATNAGFLSPDESKE